MGLNGALSLAARSLEVFSAGIEVAGNNIANANTPGAIRDQLVLRPTFPTRQGMLVFGNGVIAAGVRQQIDVFLEKRIHVANGDFEGAHAREAIYQQLEGALQELGNGDLSTGLTSFLARLNDLANQPEDAGNRQIAVQQGIDFGRTILNMRQRLDALRTSLNVKVDDLVGEANRLIDEVAGLNPRIIALESSGLAQSDAGGLRTQRYIALNRLSEIVPIHTIEHANGQVDVFLNSEHLLLAADIQHLESAPSVDRNIAIHTVRVEGANALLTGSQGDLNGVLNGRDTVVGGFIDRLDALASNFIFEFNKLHASGQGTNGFDSVTGTYAVTSATAALNAAGLAFAPQNGSFQLKLINQTSGAVTTSNIDIDLDGIGSETTLTSLAAQIDGLANVSATITSDRKLSITAAGGYEIQFAADTSSVLAALGINTFFTGTNSQTIGVNAALAADPGLLATGQGGGPADGRNALALARFADNPLAALGNATLEQYYQASISQIAQASASESALSKGYETFRDSLLSQRDQFSGISLDEEVVQILKFQRAFQMSGKYISTIDELFRTLLQI